MIVPNKFLRTEYGIGLRSFLSEKHSLSRIVDFGAEQVFCATTYTCLLFLQNKVLNSFTHAIAKANPQLLGSVSFSNHKTDSLNASAWTFENQVAAGLVAKLGFNSRKLLDELTQIKRHRGGETEWRQKGSLTHGKKTPGMGVNEHE